MCQNWGWGCFWGRVPNEFGIVFKHRTSKNAYPHTYTHNHTCLLFRFVYEKWRKGGEILTSFLNKTRLWFMINDDDIWIYGYVHLLIVDRLY